jgi:PTH1 family peptidyl-tRNA hydrolase
MYIIDQMTRNEATSGMYLWVGLGNPGLKYENTRHNIGARILVDLFPGVSLKPDKSLKSIKGEVIIESIKHVIILPQTFMNLSGDAVSQTLTYYNIKPENMIVLHDEIELSPGLVAYKFGGGHRGHNGLRDIILKICSNDFHRIRIGVGRPLMGSVADYVLSKIPESETADLKIVQNIIDENILNIQTSRLK